MLFTVNCSIKRLLQFAQLHLFQESEDNNNLSRVHSKSDQLTQIKADCKIDDGYKKVNELGHLMPSYLSKAEQGEIYFFSVV